MNTLIYTFAVGAGATAVMDLWGYARKPLLGVAPPNYALVGRWVAHMRKGQFRHASIAKSAAVRGEQAIGWALHYATGIAFAALLVALGGKEWMQEPTPALALALGIGTVAAPFLLMQPGMGLGFAASRAPNPAAARSQSLLTHAVFGLGLYAAGMAMNFFYPN